MIRGIDQISNLPVNLSFLYEYEIFDNECIITDEVAYENE